MAEQGKSLDVRSIPAHIQNHFRSALGFKRRFGHASDHNRFPPIADIVGGIRVERRIEIDQVNALGRDAVAENREVVAVVQSLRLGE